MVEAAFYEFLTLPKVGIPSFTDSILKKVAGPLKTVVVLLRDKNLKVCLVTTPMETSETHTAELIKSVAGKTLGIPQSRVFTFSSHNHCVPKLKLNGYAPWKVGALNSKHKTVKILPVGKIFIRQLRQACKKLPELLQPVTIHWAVGQEGRVTYNRKGRRADGSTYFMREEDRMLVAKDYTGDIDKDAMVVCLKAESGRPIGFLTQFTGHPITTYHPEHLTAFGEWPQVACDFLSNQYGGVPVGFLQGCAGDTNSKNFLSGNISKSKLFGRYLGQTFVKAAKKLKPSVRKDMDLRTDIARIPFAKLPSLRALERELQEITDFIRRAQAGDENTRSCVGLNFPSALSPVFRAYLVKMILPWTRWALRIQKKGKSQNLPSHLEMLIMVLRIGDVGIVGMPCEPFLGIGRTIKKNSPLPIAIPCGFMDANYGYIPDAPNTGDREYMSSFYRYTGCWPPFKKPGGDALSSKALQLLKDLKSSAK